MRKTTYRPSQDPAARSDSSGRLLCLDISCAMTPKKQDLQGDPRRFAFYGTSYKPANANFTANRCVLLALSVAVCVSGEVLRYDMAKPGRAFRWSYVY